MPTPTLTGAPINFTASGLGTAIAAPAQGRIQIWRLFLVAAGPVTIQIFDGATGLGQMQLAAGIPLFLRAMTDQPSIRFSTGNAFQINSSAATQVGGFCHYNISNT